MSVMKIRLSGYQVILKIALPLILTTSTHMIMQFIDALFLSWYSPDAVAAVGPAGMVSWLLLCPFYGTVGFVGTLVAQYVGAGKPERSIQVVWQGIYFSLVVGSILACAGLLAKPLFQLVGHSPEVQVLEEAYFSILCIGSPLILLYGVLNGYLTGIQKTRIILISQVLGVIINSIGDWILIFGHWGFPKMGIHGAAWAVVFAELGSLIYLVAYFVQTVKWSSRKWWQEIKLDLPLMKTFITFGFPNGMRSLTEMVAWTLFLFFIGRIGTVELMVSNIVWRINGIAFFPIIGLSTAVGVLVGNAQGKGNHQEALRVTERGLILAELWMIISAVLFVCCPRYFLQLFHDPSTMDEILWDQVLYTGTILLRMIALYSLLDGVNIMLLSVLQSAGDTRWTFVVSLVAHLIFIGALFWADQIHAGLYIEWLIATIFVMGQSLIWFIRFVSGRWKSIQVVETVS